MASILQVEQIQGPTSGANANTITIPAGQTLDASAGGMSLPAGVGGKLLQVVQTVMDDNLTYSTTSAYDITGMVASITPSSTNSRILIRCQLHYGQGASSTDDFVHRIRIKRNGSLLSYTTDSGRTSGDFAVYKANWDTLTMDMASFERIDTPNTTSEVTYQLEGWSGSWASNSVYYNRPNRFDDNNYVVSRARSTLTLMEIAG